MKTFITILLLVLGSTAGASDEPLSCRDSILKTTCLVEGDLEWDPGLSYFQNHKRPYDRVCLQGSKKYAQILFDLYPSLPAHTQKAFCLIKKIFIVSGETTYGGRAEIAYNYENPEIEKNPDGSEDMGLIKTGFVLSLSKKGRFDRLETAVEFENRIYQLYFGINILEGDEPSPELPYFERIEGPTQTSLYKTIVHEVGHFFDYAQERSDHRWLDESLSAYVATSAWAQLSWSLETVKYNDSFVSNFSPNLIEPLFTPLDQGLKFEPKDWRSITESLGNSDFLSFYSTSTTSEDFAETYTHVVSQGYLQLVKDQEVFYSNSSRTSPVLIEKQLYIERMLSKGFEEILNQGITWMPNSVAKTEPPQSQQCNLPQ